MVANNIILIIKPLVFRIEEEFIEILLEFGRRIQNITDEQ
jgi:hypothetical protein